MALYDRSNPLINNTKQAQTRNINAIENIRRGNLIGAAKNLIKDFILKFNLFNKNNNYELRLEEADIRRYKGEAVSFSEDLVYISSFSEKEYSPRFIQFFLPHKSIFTVLDHMYGGEFSGEYHRNFSKIDLRMLEWYFNFFNRYKEADYPLLYDIPMDISGAFPLDQLFSGLNLVIGFIPFSLRGSIFTEALIRINMEALEKIVFSVYQKNKDTYEESKREMTESSMFSINRRATQSELDDIIRQIIKQ